MVTAGARPRRRPRDKANIRPRTSPVALPSRRPPPPPPHPRSLLHTETQPALARSDLMLLIAYAALALQQPVPPPAPPQQPPDTVIQAEPARADSARAPAADTTRRPPRRIPVTAELERSAFLDASARELLHRAREARLHQDTTLISYDAIAYQRVSMGLALRKLVPERLAFREDQAVRVQWHRDRGVYAEMLGHRRAVPVAGDDADTDDDIGQSIPIPYLPGQETLWIGAGMAEVEVNDRGPVNPLASGAEAYYRYAVGDSLTLQLPDGRVIRLRELR